MDLVSITSPMVPPPYLSRPWSCTVTVFPKTSAGANCLARLPNAWRFSGQSIPPQPDAFAFPIVQDGDHVAIADAYHRAGEVGPEAGRGEATRL